MTTSIESEQGILGAILQKEDALIDVVSKVKVDDFSQQGNRLIYQAMLDLHEKKQTVDIITVMESVDYDLKRYVGDLIKQPGAFRGLKTYIDRLIQTSTSRKLIGVATQIIDIAQNQDAKIALELAHNLLEGISSNDIGSDPKHVSEPLNELIESLERRQELDGRIEGLETGFNTYDERLQGIKDTDLVILAARPSMGKTTFGLNIIENAIYHKKLPALIFSMEMSAEQLVEKSVASLGSIDLKDIKSGRVMQTSDSGKLVHTFAKLNESQLYIDDTPAQTVSDVRAKAHSINRKVGGLSAIMVDYIGLMEDITAGDNMNLKVTRITGGLKALAKELKCPVIALCQLNRGVETRQDKRPMLSDLRDSGSIEQDGDIITFLYRDEYYNKDTTHLKGVTELITGKFRMGEVGTDCVGFDGAKSRFTNLDYIPSLEQLAPTKNNKKGVNY